MSHYDVIVIGAGGVGSAALYHVARRGARVLGLDRFPPGHDRGSSHGGTRMIRLAYHEHPDYVPLLLRAYELWQELESDSKEKLYHEVGILAGGMPDGEMIAGMLRSAAQFDLPLERLSTQEAHRRWPGYRLPDEFSAVFERRAGYLLVERCVEVHAQLAVAAGAELRTGVDVQSWDASGSGVTVKTDHGTFTADRLIITAGAWATTLLRTLAIQLQVLRKPLFWYRGDESLYRVDLGSPCFLFETMGGIFYGFPRSNELGVKVAEHSGGDPVEDPLYPDRGLHASDQARVEEFLARHLPGVTRECTAHAVCMYTMTPDGHFVVDQHPEHPQVSYTAGLSGHGFKFTPVLGEIMAQLALDGSTRHPIEFLSAARTIA